MKKIWSVINWVMLPIILLGNVNQLAAQINESKIPFQVEISYQGLFGFGPKGYSVVYHVDSVEFILGLTEKYNITEEDHFHEKINRFINQINIEQTGFTFTDMFADNYLSAKVSWPDHEFIVLSRQLEGQTLPEVEPIFQLDTMMQATLDSILLYANSTIQRVSTEMFGRPKHKYFEVDNLIHAFADSTLVTHVKLKDFAGTTLPPEIGDMKAMVELSIQGGNLESLPEEIAQCDNLSMIFIDDCPLAKLPDSFGQLKNLRKLSIHNSNMTRLPESIGQLKTLWEVTIVNSRLNALPPSFGQLKNLTSLSLRNNDFNIFPQSVLELESLLYLNLEGNQIKNLPESIGQLEHLGIFYLSEVPDNFNAIKEKFPRLNLVVNPKK